MTRRVIWLLALAACGDNLVAGTPDAVVPDAQGACGTAAEVDLLLENASVGWQAVAPDGRHLAVLVDYDAESSSGDLRIIDLATGGATGVIAPHVRAPAWFTHDGSAVVYTASPTRVFPGAHVTWDLRAYNIADAEISIVGSDVTASNVSRTSPFVAYHTPDATYVYDVVARTPRLVSGGANPCGFDPDAGFMCGPLSFANDDQLWFMAQREPVWPFAATLAWTNTHDPSITTTLATGVRDYSTWAGGKVVLFTRGWTFDDSACMCPRGDLVAAAIDGSFVRTLLAQARYASSTAHATVDASGTTAAYYDPDRNPTEATLLSLTDGTVRWSDPDGDRVAGTPRAVSSVFASAESVTTATLRRPPQEQCRTSSEATVGEASILRAHHPARRWLPLRLIGGWEKTRSLRAARKAPRREVSRSSSGACPASCEPRDWARSVAILRCRRHHLARPPC